MRITVLWASLASYSCAFFREIANLGCPLQIVYQPVDEEAPYQGFDLSFCTAAMEDFKDTKARLDSMVSDFRPDCILMSTWCYPHFRKLARAVRKKGVYVVSAMDNQWHGSLRQHIGVLSSRFFLKPCIDTFFLPGDRQAYFARKLGYGKVIYGFGATDVRQYSSAIPITRRPGNFLFFGRLLPIKGVRELIDAYAIYRKAVKEPWGLKVVGKGPMD